MNHKTFMQGTNVTRAGYISESIKNSLKNKTPFSLVRFGDGELKLIDNWIKWKKSGVDFNETYENFKKGDEWEFYKKLVRQGIRINKIPEIMDVLRDSSNESDFISNFDAWFSSDYWPRRRSKKTENLLRNFRYYYNYIGIKEREIGYCNPDIGFLLFTGKHNILNFLKDKKICLITPFEGASKKLRSYGYKADKIETKLPSELNKFEVTSPPEIWHSDIYKNIMDEIEEKSKTYDIFLVGAGIIGKAYPMQAKRCGRIGIDIGKVMDAWDREWMAPRLDKKMKISGISFVVNDNKNF